MTATMIPNYFRLASTVWFGANVTVLPGVTIGDHTVIGAGSVITGDLPPNVVAAGSPCRPLRQLLLEPQQKTT